MKYHEDGDYYNEGLPAQLEPPFYIRVICFDGCMERGDTINFLLYAQNKQKNTQKHMQWCSCS